MKENLSILLLGSLFVMSGCNAKSVENYTDSKILVEPCGFDYDIDNYYCKTEQMSLYKKNIGSQANFDKYYTIIKINDGKYLRLVALNQKNLKVYPLNYQIGQKNAKFEYSENKNILCVTGNFYSYRDDYDNSKICFKIENGTFVKNSISKNLVNKNNSDKFKSVMLPNASDFLSNCLKKESQEKCEKLSAEENHVYILEDVQKKSPQIADFFNNQKIKNLNLDGFKFLPSVGDSQYVIGEKYQDTDEGSNTYYYLLKIKPSLDIKNIGANYSIDKQFNLIYKDASGNKKNFKLN